MKKKNFINEFTQDIIKNINKLFKTMFDYISLIYFDKIIFTFHRNIMC